MNKAVLISIRPEWCEKIASGQKTIEVRKTCPKIETPFKCFIYETQHANRKKWINLDNPYGRVAFAKGRGQVIGEFICKEIIVDRVGEYSDIFTTKGCMSLEEQKKYGKKKPLYGWSISDLVIYDKPKGLSDFQSASSVLSFGKDGQIEYTGLNRPPQSWCYVEEIK